MGTVRFKGAKPNKLGNYEEGELKIYSFGNKEVAGAQLPDVDYGFVDPILANNSWKTIRIICENGDAPNYWALGDKKYTTIGSLQIEWRIADMDELYGKHVVFASWNASETEGRAWDDSGTKNNYADSDVVDDLAEDGVYFAEFVDAELGAELTNTTVPFAGSGTATELSEITQKLFLPAEKELTATRVHSVQAEFDALTTFAYFKGTNDTDAFRVRRKASAPTSINGNAWWLRSPRGDATPRVVFLSIFGTFSYTLSYHSASSFGVCPCFAF